MTHDDKFKFRLYQKNVLIKTNKIKLLDNEEKILLIKCLSRVVDPKLLNQIITFINDDNYTINLKNKLNEEELIVLKDNNIIKNIYYIDTIYYFVDFLYNKYNLLLSDNHIYENLKLFLDK